MEYKIFFLYVVITLDSTAIIVIIFIGEEKRSLK